jgi:hypothetical protein
LDLEAGGFAAIETVFRGEERGEVAAEGALEDDS